MNNVPMEEAPGTAKKSGHMFRKSLTAVLLMAAGVFVGRYVIPASVEAEVPFQIISDNANQRQFVFPTFWEAWDTLHENFLEDLDDKDLFYGAVEGMVAATGDPYTAFSDPKSTKQFRETLQGEFSGIGIEIGIRQGLVTVIAPLDGSPAEAAGIEAGDIIVGVDGEDVEQNTTIDEVVRKIRGQRGEAVTLKIARQGQADLQDIVIVRDIITIESIKLNIDNRIAHLEVTSFNGDTAEQFAAAAGTIAKSDVSGIVLDVRGNPGGFLQTAVDIASFFLEPGTPIVSERGKEDKEYKAKGNPILRDIPVVVLVDQGSASASEILAGALQDQRQVKIIGEQSFGKGSVQELIDLKDGSSVRVTIAKWYTPGGRSINEEGITPDIKVEDDRETEDIDEQLERAIEELN